MNEKLTDAFEQNKDSKVAKQFQQMLDEDAELIDSVLTKTSELKVLKVELERMYRELEVQSKDIPNTISSQMLILLTYGLNLMYKVLSSHLN